MDDFKPIIGITMGDPAGIGPEIVAKALSVERIYEDCKPVVIGDAGVIRNALNIVGSNMQIKSISKIEQCDFEFGQIDVYDLKNVDTEKLESGRVSALAGNAAFDSIKTVIELALAKRIHATVTGPINKESINLAGYHYSGQTEIYAHFTHSDKYAMMLVEGNLRVVHVTTHVSLRQACDLIKMQRVLDVIHLADDACGKLGIETPRIGVAGLNPHSSDGGLFGWEEKQEITPAIEAAKSSGIVVDGPIPGDTLFSKAKGGQYDVVVAMYHDQGHIPLKLVGFIWNDEQKKWDSVSGINITLGLPIIRVSVDHGTAFDQAGKGTAIADSLISAIDFAATMASNNR